MRYLHHDHATGLRRSGLIGSHSAARPALGVALLLLVANGQAESMLQSARSPGKVSTHLDFRIVVPKVVRLDAGTGALFTNAGRAETVLISTEGRGMRRTSVSPADRTSLRGPGTRAVGPAVVSSAPGSVSYTITMP